ncbi:MAG: hypothetical protein SH850_25020, partial [Planctomycetaceae bacterium]|nr:hypothetical protein [Planctomycetaceae bacterium]
VVVGTMLPRLSVPDATRLSFNALIMADSTSWNAKCDFGAEATMGQYANVNNPTYYLDGIHPTAAGQALLATNVGNAALAAAILAAQNDQGDDAAFSPPGGNAFAAGAPIAGTIVPGAANTGSTGQQVAPAGPPTTITASIAKTEDDRAQTDVAPYAFMLDEPLTAEEEASHIDAIR